MQPTPFIAQLVRSLPADARALVLTALQSTPTLWTRLQQDAALAQKALGTLGADPTHWTPGHLTRILLDLPLPMEEAPPPEVRQEAARTYAAFRSQEEPPRDAHTVALLTLVLTEQRRLTGSWDELGTTLGDPSAWAKWREPFAAAYSLAADRTAMTETLLTLAPWEGFRLAFQALLALPLPAEAQQAHIAALLQRLPLPLRLRALERLAYRQPQWLPTSHALWERAPLPPPYAAWVQGLLHLHQAPETARQRLGEAWELGRRFQAQAAAALGWLAQAQGDLITAQTAWAQANEGLPSEPLYLARRILTTLALGQLEAAYHLLPEKPQHPALLLAAARLSAARSEPQALQWAQEALQAARHTPLPPDLLTDLARLFFDLERPALALAAVRQALWDHPTRADLHDLAAEAALRSQNGPQAVEHAALALHLSPTPHRQRTYAQALTLGQYWDEALDAWQKALAATSSPSVEDRLTLARVALKAAQPDLARQTLEALLAEVPHEPRGLALLGEILAAQGQIREAETHLRQAIRRVPQAPELHLALARVLRQQGKTDEGLETLRLAAQSLPQAAPLQAALGRELLRRGRVAQALPALQRAYQLAPEEDPTLVLDLGQALLRLQRVDEALSLLEKAYRRRPDLAGLKALLGEAYLQAGKPQQAMPLLAQAMQQGPITPHLLLHYARAVLDAGEEPTLVVRTLQQHRAWLDDADVPAEVRAELGLTLATALEAIGDHAQALDLYHQVGEQSPTPALQQKAAQGVARTALATDQPSLAVAVLEGLDAPARHDPEVTRLLAQAYAQAGLAEKALEVAAAPFQERPPNPEEALAYLALARRLGLLTHAAPVLERAHKAFPVDPRLPLALAEVYLAGGQRALAAEVLRTMLRTTYQPPLPPDALATVGQRLLQAGEPDLAAQALAQALQAQSPGRFAWWLSLVQAIQQQGAHALALEKAQQALRAFSTTADLPAADLAELHLLRAASLLALDQRPAAQQALEAAAEAATSASQWQRVSEGFTTLGDYPAALTALERALSLEERPEWALQATALALALLQYAQARRWLEGLPPEALDAPLEAQRRRLLASLRLALEPPPQALEGLEAWLAEEAPQQATPQDGYLLALQARRAAFRQDTPAARQALHQALNLLKQAPPTFAHAPAWEEAALAALDLWEHDVAVDTLCALSDALPRRPRAALLLAQAVVRRAERRHLLLKVEVLPPDDAAPHQVERQLWETALQRAAQGLGLRGQHPQDWVEHPLLGRWVLRGLALWTSEIQPGELLNHQPTPDDVVASLLAAWRRGHRLPRIPSTLPHLTDPEVQATLALLVGQPGPALAHAQRAVEKASGNAIFHALLGRLALEQGATAQALQAYQAALTLAPDHPRWHARAAQAAARLGETGLHLHHLEQAARLEPTSLPHALALAEAYTHYGQGEQALEVLRRAEKEHGEHPDLLLAFARLSRALDRRDAALAYLQRAHERAPERLDILLLLAEHHLEAGHLPQAAALLDPLPVTEKPDPQVVLLKARLAEAQGDPQAALRLLEQAALQVEDRLPLLVTRAEMLQRLRGPKAAVEAWQALTEIRPDMPLLWAHLAEALAAAGEPQAAQQAAQKALRGAETLPLEQQARLYLLVGRLARQQGQLDQAVHYLSEAIALYPTVEAYLELGRAEADRRRPDQALQAYERAMQLDPTDARPHYHAGLLYRDIHDYPQAERHLRRAAHLDPKNLAIRRALAAVASINLLHPIQSTTHEE